MKRRGRPPYPDLLTPREQQVLALLREGLSNDQIATRLGISLAGAKYHVSEILSKLGVPSRDQAARWRGEARPWWLAAIAPFDALRHRFGWLPAAVLGATTVALVAAAALLIWGLMRTDGAEPLSAATTTRAPTRGVTPRPTSTPVANSAFQTPLPNPSAGVSTSGDIETPLPIPDDPLSTDGPPTPNVSGFANFQFCVNTYDETTLEQGPDRITVITLNPPAPQSQVSLTKVGCARFANVPPGPYVISFETERGFATQTDVINLTPSEDGQINFGIAPPKP